MSGYGMPFGAEIHADGVRFALWAPAHERIALQITGQPDPLPMHRGAGGWQLTTARAAAVVCVARRHDRAGSGIPLPARRYPRRQRGDRSARLRLGRCRLARSPLA